MSAVAIAGAVFFMVADSLIAESRFVREQRWHGVGIMVTYHAALAGLVLGFR
ncbi:MAG: lysoplasmalogenase family protein [Actinomycetota bacterium]